MVMTSANICGVISVHARRILSFMFSSVIGATAITRSVKKTPIKSNLVMLDLANDLAKPQGHLVLPTFHKKSHSSLVLNTEHNGVVHRRVASTCSCEHARARLPITEAVRIAESLRKLAQSSDLQKNMDQ